MPPAEAFGAAGVPMVPIVPVGQWPAGVSGWMSTRQGGHSQGPYAGFNLGLHVGDDAAVVNQHRAQFEHTLGGPAAWLNQVHGAQVLDADEVLAARREGRSLAADACVARRPAQVAAVLVADCLPVLMARSDGQAVAAAHAGWRGLAAGVLEATVAALRADSPGEVMAWLGPCIGPQAFEVGDDVKAAFGPAGASCFQPHHRADGSAAWLCHLPELARLRLGQAGVTAISGGQWCTVRLASTFFSYRRDGVTGRMAAGIVIGR
jgi:polyphenol oxidase